MAARSQHYCKDIASERVNPMGLSNWLMNSIVSLFRVSEGKTKWITGIKPC